MLLAPALSWAMICRQTDFITAGISNRVDPTLVLNPPKKHLYDIYTMVDQHRTHWAVDV